MTPDLEKRYPLAKKAFAAQDAFYAGIGEPLPEEVAQVRERVAVIIDQYCDNPPKEKEAFIIAAVVALDPLSSHDIYGDPAYPGVAEIMTTLIRCVKNHPNDPLPASVTPVITAIAIAKMEQTTDRAAQGKLQVTPAAVKGSLKRGAINDALYLPNLHNKKLQDLYETVQFAYFTALEKAALKGPKPPPPPPNPGGPVF